MSDEERPPSDPVKTPVGGPAPEGVSDRDTPGGPDETTKTAEDAPARHPSEEITADAAEVPEAPTADASDDPVLSELLGRFDTASLQSSHGQDVVSIDPSELLAFAESAKEAGFEMCVDVTAVDWFRSREPRYDVIISLLSIGASRRLRIRVPVERTDPVVPSLVPVWPGANFAEREVYDMFGIRFEGHPDLTRILMPDDWEGYPLRKDFGVGAVPVQFKGSHKVN